MGWGPGWPMARPGMAVGLLGGSFDPAHAGHAHLTRAALARFGLDAVWWLVSPGNPLKPSGPAPMAQRMDRARKVMDHPHVEITDIEAHMGVRHTARTLGALVARYPGVRFVWLMGADNMATLHKWEDWKQILHTMPVGVVARPGDRLAALTSPAARAFRAARVTPDTARGLAHRPIPAWAFVNLPLRPESSTALRESGAWPQNDP
ncbi:nicotinate-nucleotide adenylyltransferase [Palleronia pelagia]|uniref:Probable nicotinate-nucleotide adenylyltransferase n=1 Tax=Palleronia pelagia TaxID=387096 RepID=A0A1H8KS95_9RHOB|nr:nicotinate-nucleotide adenylyltransferase [Palleronia pelagia]SEN95763.1 nicotinate-nucleotide adenylyltransferase [Palleronia pelagia]